MGRSCLVTCSERPFVKATGQIGIDSPNLNIKLDTISNIAADKLFGWDRLCITIGKLSMGQNNATIP